MKHTRRTSQAFGLIGLVCAILAVVAQRYYAFAEGCVGRDFGNPGFLSKYCSTNPDYNYELIAKDWSVVVLLLVLLSVASLIAFFIFRKKS